MVKDLRLFQFHFGLIKSAGTLLLKITVSRFQFHFGLIKRTLITSFGLEQTMFQFHFGLIKSVCMWVATMPVFFVSIPFWSD